MSCRTYIVTLAKEGGYLMEWQQLEYFHVVARLQHFTRAAKQLSVSQSALSRSISRLEKQLGVKLFERQGRGVVLNRYGRALYDKTYPHLQQLMQAKEYMAGMIDPECGNISLAFLKSLGAEFVPRLVSRFLEQNPRIRFELFQNATNVMLDRVEAGEIDFCLSTETETRPTITWKSLWTESMCVFVPVGHELAHRKAVSLYELASTPLIVLKQGYGTRTILDQLFKSRGIVPQILFEGEEIATLMGFVRAKLGVTVLPPVRGIDLEGIVQLNVVFERSDSLGTIKATCLLLVSGLEIFWNSSLPRIPCATA